MQYLAYIVVLDDEPGVRSLLERYLTKEGFDVSTASSGDDLIRKMAERPVDLVVLDLIMPGQNGLEIARELRSESDVGIVILTAKSDTVDRIVGLEIGADDYLTKPFEPRELLARIRSVLRRRRTPTASAGADSNPTAAFAGWRLDFGAQELTAPDGKRVPLTTYEYKLLAALIQHAKQPLDRDELLEFVSGRSWRPNDRSIDILIGKLRQKIEQDPKQPTMIKTIRGAGYMLAADVASRPTNGMRVTSQSAASAERHIPTLC